MEDLFMPTVARPPLQSILTAILLIPIVIVGALFACILALALALAVAVAGQRTLIRACDSVLADEPALTSA
jgi:cell division protein FtsL